MKKIYAILIGLFLVISLTTANILSNRQDAITEARAKKTIINTATTNAFNSISAEAKICSLDIETELETNCYRWVEYTFEGETERVRVNHLNISTTLKQDTPQIEQKIGKTIARDLGNKVEYEP